MISALPAKNKLTSTRSEKWRFILAVGLFGKEKIGCSGRWGMGRESLKSEGYAYVGKSFPVIEHDFLFPWRRGGELLEFGPRPRKSHYGGFYARCSVLGEII
jgi:hypothetical protein